MLCIKIEKYVFLKTNNTKIRTNFREKDKKYKKKLFFNQRMVKY